MQMSIYQSAEELMNVSDGTKAEHAHLSEQERNILSGLLATSAAVGILVNLLVTVYILARRLFRNFVSNHFIAHLGLTGIIACSYLTPIFIQNVRYGTDYLSTHDYNHSSSLCRLHAFTTCSIWSVTYYMTTCIAGVHLLTFARIHYDQLFGLHPSIICLLSWVIGVSLGLPCLTNESIVAYDSTYHHCLWNHNQNGYKFLAYFVLLGILLPTALTMYSYVRVLAIFYHAPIVFETLGLFKSRYLLFAVFASHFLQWPFFIRRFVGSPDPLADTVTLMIAYQQNTVLSIIYGVSLFMMKEDDLALTTRSHKITYAPPPQQVAQQEL
ncbi:hypothetical protein M514_04039 [Trichuris suis]|uniref:G-protein coupled receptors family 1 profile domain-containing protein n=1 Tax=Trichuris suis TaxID=68888 RepID=A0A085NST2_9BILA|nr:hypothetical protein M513_04039 [Trichuris suis]KFD72528.1 hypothetical protein M514_04039 [Trichuris suis]